MAYRQVSFQPDMESSPNFDEARCPDSPLSPSYQPSPEVQSYSRHSNSDNEFNHDFRLESPHAYQIPEHTIIDYHHDSPTTNALIRRKPVPALTTLPDADKGSEKSTLLPSNSTIEVADDGNLGAEAARPVWRMWAIEIVSTMLSILLLATTVVVLSKYNNRPLPRWPFGFTLNSFLAIFTTLTKSAFMLPVSSAISQTQWTWFTQKPQPLYDIYVIDQASRGAWGALVLLWRFRMRHLIFLGGLLMALSSLTSPVTQLAINYLVYDDKMTGELATMPILANLRVPRDYLEDFVYRAVYTATFLDQTMFDESLDYSAMEPNIASCPTGNCTFATYQSLGICAKFENISSHLTIRGFDNPDSISNDSLLLNKPIPSLKTWQVSLPNAVQISHQSPKLIYSTKLNGNLSFAYPDDVDALNARAASLVIIYTTPKSLKLSPWSEDADTTLNNTNKLIYEVRHEAIEVLLHLCVQTYETEIRSGKETTRMTRSSTHPRWQHGTPHYTGLDYNTTCLLPKEMHTPQCESQTARQTEKVFLLNSSDDIIPDNELNNTDGDMFSADFRSLNDLSDLIRVTMAGSEVMIPHPSEHKKWIEVVSRSPFIDSLRKILFEDKEDGLGRRRARLANLFQNIETGLSVSSRAPRSRRLLHGIHNITGQPLKDIVVVRITWGWISLLAAEVFIAVLYVSFTIAGHYRAPRPDREHSHVFRDIKDSNLGTLVALSQDCRSRMGGKLKHREELERVGKELRVMLEDGQLVVGGSDAAEEKCS